MGISQRIIVVASPNVQDNFRKQLFDENQLKLVDGLQEYSEHALEISFWQR